LRCRPGAGRIALQVGSEIMGDVRPDDLLQPLAPGLRRGGLGAIEVLMLMLPATTSTGRLSASWVIRGDYRRRNQESKCGAN
jgi:hypothetical protein